jgi:hypothetical protein
MHTHRLHPTTHAALLAQDRRDPISGDFLQEGDEVVFCAACRSAFLKDSWEYLGKTHCGQRETLQDVPAVHEGVKLKRVKVIEKMPAKPKLDEAFVFRKVSIILLDCLIFWCLFIPLLALAQLSFVVSALLSSAVFLLWEIPFKGSAGKKLLDFVITHKTKSAKASYFQIFMRGVLKLSTHWAAYALIEFGELMGFGLLVLALFVFFILALFGRSVVSQITQTCVIPENHYEWYAYQARHQRNVQL